MGPRVAHRLVVGTNGSARVTRYVECRSFNVLHAHVGSVAMRSIGNRIALLVVLTLAACTNTAECDCIAPSIVVFGTVTGAAVPVEVDVRLGQGVCRDGISLGTGSRAPVDANGSYQVGINLPPPGPACVVVSARTLDIPSMTTTRRVDATITPAPNGDPQRIRVDVALGTE